MCQVLDCNFISEVVISFCSICLFFAHKLLTKLARLCVRKRLLSSHNASPKVRLLYS